MKIFVLVVLAILSVAAGYILRDMRVVMAGGEVEDQWL
jgi:hypothetical protein